MVQNRQSFVPNIFFNQICQKIVDLFKKNMKGWSDKKIILYLFCSFDLLRKKVENNFFIRAAVLCANISQIFFSQFDHQKYLRCLFKSLFNWSPHFFHILQQACWNFNWFLWKFSCCFDCYHLVSKYMLESETDQLLFNLKQFISLSIPFKWRPQVYLK